VDFVLHYADDHWDNNGGGDYHVPIQGQEAPFVLDGILDADATWAGCSAPGLWFAHEGSTLYLATETDDDDVFLLVADTPGAPVSAPWAKAGQMASWDAFLAREGDNGWAGWFGTVGGVATGEVLEGTVDLAALLGGTPARIHVAALRYASPDGGVLRGQCPAGDLVGGAWLAVDLTPATDTPPAPRPPTLHVAPNPFNPTARVAFTLPRAGAVRLDLFDARGRRIRPLVDGSLPAGHHAVDLEADGLASGVYFLRLQAPELLLTRRTVLLK
jgi:hypothetical protein